jgi:hypothetical protein
MTVRTQETCRGTVGAPVCGVQSRKKTGPGLRRLRTAIPLAVMLTLLGLLGILLEGAACLSQVTWVSLADTASVPYGEPERQLVSLGLDSLVLRVRVPGISVAERRADGRTFDEVKIPGESRLASPGKPMLPEMDVMIAAPEYDELRLECRVVQCTTLAGYRAYPAPKQVVREWNGVPYISDEFCIDEEIYESEVVYPQDIAEVVRTGWIRDQRVVSLAIHPIQYLGGKDALRVCREVEIRVFYANASPGVAVRGTGPFEDLCRRTILGYDKTHPGSYPSLLGASPGSAAWAADVDDCISNGTDYLIVAADRFCAGSARATLESFAQFRACSTGYNVSMVPVSDMGMSDVAMRGFIQDLYESRSAAHWWDGHLGFVLLVGDYKDPSGENIIPIHRVRSPHGGTPGVADSFPADNWYGCVSDDAHLPAVMIGRLCVDDSTELENMVAKILDYEPVPDEAWSRKVFLTAGTSPSSDTAAFEGHLQDIESVIPQPDFKVSTLKGYLECPSQWGCEHDLAQMNVDSLNAGCFFAHYVGHGGPCQMGYFSPASFTSCSVESLNNGGMPCIFTSIGCRTATFDYFDECGDCTCPCAAKHDCVAERLLNVTSGGAVAYIGNTDLGRISDADLWLALYEAVFQTKVRSIGMAFAEALFRKADQTQADRLVLLGDPALQVWYRAPAREKWDLWLRGAPEADPVWFDPPAARANVPDSTGLRASVVNMTSVDLAIDQSEPGVGVGFYMKDSLNVWQLIGMDTLRTVAAWDSVISEVPFYPCQYALGTYDFRVVIDPDGDFEDVELFRHNNEVEIELAIGLWWPGPPPVLPAAPSSDPIVAYLKTAEGTNDQVVLFPCDDSRVYGVDGVGGFHDYKFKVG